MSTFSPHRASMGRTLLLPKKGFIDVRALLESGGAYADALESSGSFTHAFEILARFEVPSVTLHLVRGQRHMLVLWAMINDNARSQELLAEPWPAGFFYQGSTSFVASEGLSLPKTLQPSIVDVMGFCMPVQPFELSMITMFKPRHALQFTYAHDGITERHVFPASPRPVFPDLSIANQNGSMLYLVDAYGVVRDKHALSVPQTYVFQDVLIDATSASKAFERVFQQPHDFLVPPTPTRITGFLQDLIGGVVYDGVKPADISDTSVWRKVVDTYVTGLQRATGKFVGAYMVGVHKGAPHFRALKKVIDKRDYIIFSIDSQALSTPYAAYVDGMTQLCSTFSATESLATAIKTDLDAFYSSLVPVPASEPVFPSVPSPSPVDLFADEDVVPKIVPKKSPAKIQRYLRKLSKRCKTWGALRGDKCSKASKASKDLRRRKFDRDVKKEVSKALRYISSSEFNNIVKMVRDMNKID